MECGTSRTFEDGITGFHHTAGTGIARIPRQPVRRALAHPVGHLGLHGAAASRLQRNDVDQILSRHWPLASPSPEQVVRHVAWTGHDLEVKPVMQLVGEFPESRSGADLPSETATWRGRRGRRRGTAGSLPLRRRAGRPCPARTTPTTTTCCGAHATSLIWGCCCVVLPDKRFVGVSVYRSDRLCRVLVAACAAPDTRSPFRGSFFIESL